MSFSRTVKTSSSARRATSSFLAALAAGVAGGCGGSPSARPSAAAVGVSLQSLGPPVDFAFDSLDARQVSSDATRGKPTVVTFVTTGSLPSQAQVDFLVPMSRNDAERVNYAVIALEPDGQRELVEMYARALSIPFPVALADARTRAGTGAFGDVSAVPVTVLLDRVGRIVWRADGRVAKSAEIRAALRDAR